MENFVCLFFFILPFVDRFIPVWLLKISIKWRLWSSGCKILKQWHQILTFTVLIHQICCYQTPLWLHWKYDMPKVMFGPVIHETTKNMPSSKNLPRKARHISSTWFYKTVFRCFWVDFPLRKITLQSIINKLKQILLPVSTAECISMNRNWIFITLDCQHWRIRCLCVDTLFQVMMPTGKNRMHTNTFSTLITTMETEWSCFLSQQLVFMVNNICTYSSKLCILIKRLGSELNSWQRRTSDQKIKASHEQS